jgi:glutamine amidotransferase
MCRLLGVIANKPIDLKFSLLEADTSFKSMGNSNPHGWGIGWYVNGKPKIYKEGVSAVDSKQFVPKTKEVRSHIIICHVRNKGGNGAEPAKKNSHPFSFDDFLFAHNGSVDKKHLKNLLEDDYKLQLKGATDSEVYFYWLVQNIRKTGDVVDGISSALLEVRKYNHTGLNFLLSDGNTLYAFRYSIENHNYYSLYYLSRDPKYGESFYYSSDKTGAFLRSKSLNKEKAILVCSEELTKKKENWQEIPIGNLLVVRNDLTYYLEKVLD